MTTFRSVLFVCFVALMAAPTTGRAQPASPLAAPYTMTVGDLAASMLSELVRVRQDLASALVTYDPETGTIDLEVLGALPAPNRTDIARHTLARYWSLIESVHIPIVERRLKVELTAQHYRLAFYDRRTDPARPVVQYVNGQYIMP